MSEVELLGGRADGLKVCVTPGARKVIVPACGRYGFDQICYERDADGKWRYKGTVYFTKQDAEEHAAALLRRAAEEERG